MKALLYAGIIALMQPTSAGDQARLVPDAVRAEMRPLSTDSSADTRYPQPIADYFGFYGLDLIGIPHAFGTYPSGDFTLAAHVFRVPDPHGTLLVVHGYYDHVGIMRNVIRLGIDSGYTVAAIDLPGHGLSSGARASITDFSQYGEAIGDFLKLHGSALPQPLILLGHSTGCSAIIEYLHLHGPGEISKTILCAPLVRSTSWDLSRLAHWLGGSWLKRTVRWFRNSSSDRAWLDWYRNEPLQETSFPTEWATAVYAWNTRLPGYAPLTTPVTVIQGTIDETVDWKYNLTALRELCPRLTVYLIPNGRHQLANEGDAVRGEFLGLVGGELRPRP